MIASFAPPAVEIVVAACMRRGFMNRDLAALTAISATTAEVVKTVRLIQVNPFYEEALGT